MPPEPAPPRTRVRRRPEERRAEILEAAVDLVAQHGYYGLSLNELAARVGLSQAGMLHYVGNKEGLLQLLVEQRYDRRGTPTDFVATGDPAATHPDGISFPAYCRYLVDYNSKRPQLMKLYMVLGTEAASPEHPAHTYFAGRPDAVWDNYLTYTWRLPPQVGPFEANRDLVETTIEAMDGAQLRSFRNPPVRLTDEWLRLERLLFPSPLWDGFR